MTDEDLKKVGKLIDDSNIASEQRILVEVKALVTGEISGSEKRVLEVVREEISGSEKRVLGEVQKEISASEERVLGEVKGIVQKEISGSEKRVLAGIGAFMTDELIPMLDEKADKSDIERLERKIDLIADKTNEHAVRLKNIELIPAIAHELKRKKSK